MMKKLSPCSHNASQRSLSLYHIVSFLSYAQLNGTSRSGALRNWSSALSTQHFSLLFDLLAFRLEG